MRHIPILYGKKSALQRLHGELFFCRFKCLDWELFLQERERDRKRWRENVQVFIKIFSLAIFTDGILLVDHLGLELKLKLQLIWTKETKVFKHFTHDVNVFISIVQGIGFLLIVLPKKTSVLQVEAGNGEGSQASGTSYLQNQRSTPTSTCTYNCSLCLNLPLTKFSHFHNKLQFFAVHDSRIIYEHKIKVCIYYIE